MISQERSENRFQNKPWFIQTWRLRYYLLIPFAAITWWWAKPFKDSRRNWYNFVVCWKIATGTVQGKMEWWYTSEEVKKKLFSSLFAAPDKHSINEGCVIIREKYNNGKNIKKRSKNKS